MGRKPYFQSALYLAGVVIVEPALQVDGVPAWHQAAILEDPQLYWCLMACGDDVVERVLQCHWVIMGSLVLLAGRRRRGNENAGTAAVISHEGAERETERANAKVAASHLIPGVSSVSGIDEDGDDLGFG